MNSVYADMALDEAIFGVEPGPTPWPKRPEALAPLRARIPRGYDIVVGDPKGLPYLVAVGPNGERIVLDVADLRAVVRLLQEVLAR